MSELLPCPFCGSKEVCTRDVSGAEPQGDITFVECQDCFSRTAAWRTKVEAVDLWNSRAAESKGVEREMLAFEIGFKLAEKGYNFDGAVIKFHELSQKVGRMKEAGDEY